MAKNIVSKFVLVAIVLVSTCTGAFAQKTGVSLQLGGIFPAKEFSTPETSVPSIDPHLMTGASLGLRFNVKLPLGFNIFAQGELAWNSLDKDTKQLYKDESKTVPHYLNIPLIAGVRYHLSLLKIIGIYGEVGLGVDVLMKTKEGWKDDITKYSSSTKFASEYGVGVSLFNTITVGMHYYLLGDHSIIPNIEKSTSVILPETETMKAGMWALKLGIKL